MLTATPPKERGAKNRLNAVLLPGPAPTFVPLWNPAIRNRWSNLAKEAQRLTAFKLRYKPLDIDKGEEDSGIASSLVGSGLKAKGRYRQRQKQA